MNFSRIFLLKRMEISQPSQSLLFAVNVVVMFMYENSCTLYIYIYRYKNISCFRFWQQINLPLLCSRDAIDGLRIWRNGIELETTSAWQRENKQLIERESLVRLCSVSCLVILTLWSLNIRTLFSCLCTWHSGDERELFFVWFLWR